ncbi:MAG: AraC family transcriptional regulator ligand-binding domain-containing protein [Deltaproteobacteria bacterium]|nr:AraC family transcriptional regulator ligand-binding domain-containing protein [Deltaproteobacteria bacterium]
MHTISGVVAFLVGHVARVSGADPRPLLLGSGVDPDAPPAGDDHIPVERYFEVWRRAVAQFGETFPLRVASHFRQEDNEIFGFLAMSCHSLGEAFDRTRHYSRLYTVGATYEMEVDDVRTGDARSSAMTIRGQPGSARPSAVIGQGQPGSARPSAVTIRGQPGSARPSAVITWLPWPGDLDDPGYRAAMDYHVANMELAIRQLGKSPPRPIEVRLRHAAPREVAEYVAFYGVAPRFGSSRYELVYPAGLREVEVTTFNSRLRDYFDVECRKMIEKLGAATSITVQVRKALIAAMDGGDSGIETLAKRLGMSARSLQRRLSEEQTSYNDLVAEVRTEFAKRYLARGTLTASEVAYLIGFTEPPAFFKAFKRWTGLTPGEFQARGMT